MHDLLIQRRRAPRGDILSGVCATGECSDSELIANCALLLFAGHETTVNLIGNGVLALLRNPGQLQLLRAAPELVPGAVEELLRYDSPSQMTFRYAMHPCSLAGHPLSPGEPVGIVIGAANHDEAQFANPATLDIRRSPNRHLSFGNGRHTCLGGALARAEGCAALGQLVATFPTIELAPQALSWSPSLGLRGLSRLLVEVA